MPHSDKMRIWKSVNMRENYSSRRTTITLGPDVSDAIRVKLRANPRLKEKTLINELLRKALKQSDVAKTDSTFRTPVFESEFAPGVTPEKVLEMMKEM